MLDDSVYNITEVCHHGLSVAMVNKKQILFIPVLQIHAISEAAAIYDYPMDAEEIGRLVFGFFEQMKRRNLTVHTPYKKYWLMPKGIRSFKKYVQAAIQVNLKLDGDVFKAYRCFPAHGFRGFVTEDSGNDTTISATVSEKELGDFILRQFDCIEKKCNLERKE